MILIANWKMNLSAKESGALATRFAEISREAPNIEIWIAPSFTALEVTFKAVRGSNIKVGAQNVHWEDKGAFTGEISLEMLKEIGCSFTLVGHSERRILGDSDELVTKRALHSLKRSFTTVLCIGETLEQRNSDQTLKVLETQLFGVLGALPLHSVPHLIIAYEPVWAIGGRVAEPDDINEAHEFIIKTCNGALNGFTPPVLYGGSVAPENFLPIAKLETVAGALIGGASLDPGKFRDLVSIASRIA